MTTTGCIHGLDSRFCAVCNTTNRSGFRASTAAGATNVSEILECLNRTRRRATYGAVAGVLGVPPQSLEAMLGDRRPEASWVVNSETRLPTDYEQTDWHPELLSSTDVIRTSNELTLHLTLWRTKRPMSN